MEKMGSGKGNSLIKSMRRRSSARKASQDCVINVAEARREIAHALHLHRSSSSSSCVSNREPTTLGNSCNYNYSNAIFGGSQYCYSLMECMRLPEPIWSTTAPSILAAPPPPPMEALEFEWGENQASYTWWLGFLQTLDSKYNEDPKHPFGNSGVLFSQCQESPFLDAGDQSSSPDEWLMFPPTEDQSEIVIPHENGGSNSTFSTLSSS